MPIEYSTEFKRKVIQRYEKEESIPHSVETLSVSSESLLQGQGIASASGKSGVLHMHTIP